MIVVVMWKLLWPTLVPMPVLALSTWFIVSSDLHSDLSRVSSNLSLKEIRSWGPATYIHCIYMSYILYGFSELPLHIHKGHQFRHQELPLSALQRSVHQIWCQDTVSSWQHEGIIEPAMSFLQCDANHLDSLACLLQDSLGSHVVMVAQIVERITYARTGVINIHIVKAGLIPRLLALCFLYPRSSALQSSCCRTFR